MEQALEDKIKYCAKLLANSLLAEEYKELVSSLIGSMSEKQLDMVIESLEREGEELEKLGATLKKFDADQDAKWEAIRKAQEAKAKEMEDAFVAEAIKTNIAG